MRHLKPAGEAIFKDRHTTKAKELLKAWQPGERGAFAVVVIPLSKPSISHSGASFAPGAIRTALQSYTTYSGESGVELTDPILDFGDMSMDPTDVVGNQERIAEGLSDVFSTEAAESWMILGGDHSISYSSIKVFADAKRVGVIQFDAHHDLRNTEDGGPTNGTPFRRLLEDGILDGENLVQIGIRDFTNTAAYADYAKEQGVGVCTMGDVDSLGVTEILRKEIERLAEKSGHDLCICGHGCA